MTSLIPRSKQHSKNISFPLSSADTRRFSVEENELPHSGRVHRCYHRHGYDKQEAPCLTLAKPKPWVIPVGHTEESDRALRSPNQLRSLNPMDPDSSPWPALHINIDTAEEKPLSEKSLPSSPTGLQDQLHSNVRRHVMQSESGSSKGNSSSTEHNRIPGSSQDSASSSVNTDRPRVERRKRLVRQFSFNHSDEDDLPEALAAISSESSMGRSTSNSSLDKQVQPPIYPPHKSVPPLEQGDKSPLCCPSPVSHLLPLSVQSHSNEDLRLDREKLMRALLMTEL